LGVSWEQRTHLAPRLELSYSYRLERNHTFDPNPGNDPFPFDITQQVARLVGTSAFDSRDNPLNAGRGTLASWSVEYAPETLGSTSGVRFVKSLAQLYHLRPWQGTVLASAARVGLARGLGGVDLIPTEKFLAGGARTVRGVAEDSLGPVSDIFGDVVGGNAVVLFNQEVRVPVFRWLGGVVFTDVGNVFATPGQISLSDLVGSSGAGLRLSTPFGQLRVDYGRLWSPREGQPRARWSFGIGQAF
jgi:outer membrane protein assembly factor BamA